MSIRSGLAAQVGAKKESTYGTRVVPDHFVEFETENFNLQKDFLLSQQLRAGRTFQSSSRRVASTRQAGGTLKFEVPNKGFGFWLDLMHGLSVTPVQQGGTTAYLQTHNIGTSDPFGKAATIQVGKPDTGGVVRPFDYVGSKLVGWTLGCNKGEFLVFEGTFDSQDELTNQTLAAASYPTSVRSFNFIDGSIQVNASPVAVVHGFNLQGGSPQKTDRFFLGSAGLKSEPIANAFQTVDGSLSVEFADLGQYAHYTAADIVTVVLDFVGPTISGIYKEELKITLQAVGYNGDTPNVGGPDVLDQSIPFVALDDGVNPPCKIEYTSVDTTL